MHPTRIEDSRHLGNSPLESESLTSSYCIVHGAHGIREFIHVV